MASSPDSVADKHEHVLIVDFGSQVTQLIARRLRESGVYCGEGVKIHLAGIAGPGALAAVRGVVGMDDLEPCGEGNIFKDLTEAPAGDLSDAVDIACEPAGAV